jgi:hypothetical protein
LAHQLISRGKREVKNEKCFLESHDAGGSNRRHNLRGNGADRTNRSSTDGQIGSATGAGIHANGGA